MDSLRELLYVLKEEGLVEGHFRGLLHILIGRKITRTDGSAVSAGVSWRDLAALLKRVRWDREVVRELGLNPAELPPRDRTRFWYAAISRAGVDSPAALEAAERFVPVLREAGYEVGPPPRG
jgi:hypothetical protein